MKDVLGIIISIISSGLLVWSFNTPGHNEMKEKRREKRLL